MAICCTILLCITPSAIDIRQNMPNLCRADDGESASLNQLQSSVQRELLLLLTIKLCNLFFGQQHHTTERNRQSQHLLWLETQSQPGSQQIQTMLGRLEFPGVPMQYAEDAYGNIIAWRLDDAHAQNCPRAFPKPVTGCVLEHIIPVSRYAYFG